MSERIRARRTLRDYRLEHLRDKLERMRERAEYYAAQVEQCLRQIEQHQQESK